MKKFSIIITLSILFFLMITGIASAWYTEVGGVVRDSKTQSPWTYGATVNVWDCSAIDVGAPLGTGTLARDSTFAVTFTESTANRFLCVEFNFGTGPNGTPADRWEVINDNGPNGMFDLGIVYTDTGPTAVTLADISTTESSTNLPITAATFIILGSVSFITLRRRTTDTVVHTEK